MSYHFYHIAGAAEVDEYRRRGFVAPSSLGVEGFVHCSYLDQVLGVARRFFAGRSDLVLLRVPSSATLPRVEVEPVPGERDRYPHAFGAIPWSAVDATFRLSGGASGDFELPAELSGELVRRAERLADIEGAFAWYEHPEGMRFVETHRNESRTSGHFLFVRGAVSRFHRVRSGEELWAIHEGALRLHVVVEGRSSTYVLGTDVGRGERPVVAVPSGAWQAAELEPSAPLAFGSNVCAPAFDFRDLEIADAATSDRLASSVPGLAERLRGRPESSAWP